MSLVEDYFCREEKRGRYTLILRNLSTHPPSGLATCDVVQRVKRHSQLQRMIFDENKAWHTEHNRSSLQLLITSHRKSNKFVNKKNYSMEI